MGVIAKDVRVSPIDTKKPLARAVTSIPYLTSDRAKPFDVVE